MKSEYLITFDSKTGVASSREKFKNLLKVHEDIGIDKNKIKFKDLEFSYHLTQGKLTDGSNYFDLIVECGSDNHLDEFTALLREIRAICTKVSDRNVIVFNDGVGEYYCAMAYPIIFQTENLMRKLITKFMTISIGHEWRDASTPEDVLRSVRAENKSEVTNFLREVDFIQLSAFLFNNYTKADQKKLFELLKGRKSDEKIEISELKKYVPESNWEKYFSEKVNCNSDYIKSRWEKLYEFRCKVAHCKGITKSEYQSLQTISAEVCEKINEALSSIENLHIDKEDRDDVAERLSGLFNETAAKFIKSFNYLDELLTDLVYMLMEGEHITLADTNELVKSFKKKTKMLSQSGILASGLCDRLESALQFRNKLVHQMGVSEISEYQIESAFENLDMATIFVMQLLETFEFSSK